ncbi:MAG: hypothetical protein M1831_003177 [Alyxoria varia]|nr:MAG: hypothetical protein M1831_003177 [Alyxoria varia]
MENNTKNLSLSVVGGTASTDTPAERGRAGQAENVKFGREFREKWFMFDKGWVPLNHGSFGTHPHPIHTHRFSLLHAAESSPDAFFYVQQAPALRSSRHVLASLLEVPASDVVLVPNATTGVNTVLRNLKYAKGDKIAYFGTVYGAVEKTVWSVAETTEARPLRIPLEVPAKMADAAGGVAGAESEEARRNGASHDSIVAAFEATVLREREKGNKVKVLIFDTITSMPGLRMPFEALTAKCRDLGVLSLIDGAHGVGQIPLHLATLQPDFLVSNLHKWLFVPRGCAVLYVPVRNQGRIRTTFPTSHAFRGLAEGAPDGSGPLLPEDGEADPRDVGYFVEMFGFVGTLDVTNYLCVGEAIKFREEVCGGEEVIQGYLAKLAREGGDRVAQVLGTECMGDEKGSMRDGVAMVNVRLPLQYDQLSVEVAGNMGALHWMQRRMIHDMGTWIPIFWHAGCLWARFSAQIYLDVADFEWGAERLRGLCGRVVKDEHLQSGRSNL